MWETCEQPEEPQNLDAIAGIGDQKRAHDGSYGSARPELRDGGRRIHADLDGRRRESAEQIEHQKSPAAHRVLDQRSKRREKHHVADDVHPRRRAGTSP
jgi:hypothetical protein